MILERLLDVGEARRVEIRHRADRGVAIGMRRGEQPLDLLVAKQAVGLVVALPLLVLDDAALLIEHGLRDRAGEVAHPVAFEEQRAIESGGGYGPEIIGAIEAGGARKSGGWGKRVSGRVSQGERRSVN